MNSLKNIYNYRIILLGLGDMIYTSFSSENLTDFFVMLTFFMVGNIGTNNVQTAGDICLIQYIALF